MTLGGVGLRPYATFDLVIRTNKLWIAPYSQYQQSLHDLIMILRNNGKTFTEIANHLNENGYKTTRGKKFRNAHAHSIIKKKNIRDKRLNKEYEAELNSFNVLYL